MSARLPTHNDGATIECKLGREHLIEQVAREIATGSPPLVFGIHGDWGSGKTSFLCQLEHALTGQCVTHPDAKEVNRLASCKDIENVFTVWFEAWRYQNEPAPVVALLQEMCRQLPKHKKLWEKLKKGGAVMLKGIFGIVDEVSAELKASALGTGGKIGVKLKSPLPAIREENKLWEEEHLSATLTTDRVRRLLTEVIEKLLGDDKTRRVCVIIDDLDRCEATAALRLLEGIKIHLSLPQCVFVLGVNIRQIERAIAPLLPGATDKLNRAAQQAEAAEYLEKLCTFTWKLPFPAAPARAALLQLWLVDPPHAVAETTTPLPKNLRDALAKAATDFDCLPANPRKIKSLANTIRQLVAHGWHQGAAPPAELVIPEKEADTLLIAGSLYQFHSELLRYLQTYPSTWDELVNWINGKSMLPEWSDLAMVFRDLQRSAVPDSTNQSQPTPASGPLTPIFPDPAHVSVFRIHRLLREATSAARDTVTRESLSRYLSLAVPPVAGAAGP